MGGRRGGAPGSLGPDPILTRLEANLSFHLANQMRTQMRLEELEAEIWHLRERHEEAGEGRPRHPGLSRFRGGQQATAIRGSGPSWTEQIDGALGRDGSGD